MCPSLYSFWCILFLLGINLSREVIIPQWIQLLSLVLYLYLLTQTFSTYLRLDYGLMHFVTPYCKQLGRFSLSSPCSSCAGRNAITACLLHIWRWWKRAWRWWWPEWAELVHFGWGFFCVGEVYFGCLSSPPHCPTPNTVCMFWRNSISQRENVIIADFSLGSLFDC